VSGILQEPVLFHPERALYFAPVRHHSPACALALRDLMREVQPRQVLIEAPADFSSVLPVLLDRALRPPVAVVAFRKAEDETAVTSYYPFSRHAPEMVALLEAQRLGAQIRFIDLPSSTRLAAEPAPPGTSSTEPRSLVGEVPFSHSDYVSALCRRTGCRDQNELWDHLFESRIGTADWRRFFLDVGAYCAAVRATIPEAMLVADYTLAREAHMCAALRRALKREGPIVVVTGGMHTPALIASLAAKPEAAEDAAEPAAQEKIYVVRYGFRELDRLNGYASGLPLPAYYDGLWERLERSPGAPLDLRAATAELLSAFVAHVRRERPSLTPSLPAVANALETAVRLADLRGRPGPLRTDVLDAALNAFIKGEAAPDAEPVLAELIAFLRGSALGDVPPSAGSPPLVEAVRAKALEHGFDLAFAASQPRKLDIYRSDRDLAGSRFLHAMALLETGFGMRQSGPDPLSGSGRDLLFETWTASWSPMVEARLIELSRYGDTLEAAALAEVRRLLREARADPARRNAAHAVDLLARACLAGLQAHVGELIAAIDAAVVEDPDIETVSLALSHLFLAWRARVLLGLVGRTEVERLVGTAYRRTLQLAGDIGEVKEERHTGFLKSLVLVRQVVVSARGETEAIDADLFDFFVEGCLGRQLPPLLAGAIAGMAFLAGRIGGPALAARVRGQFGGAHVEPKDNVAAISGLIAVSPDLLIRVPDVVRDLDRVVSGMEDRQFIAELPHLRLAFAALNPRETDAVAALVAECHGLAAEALPVRQVLGVSGADLAAGLDLDRRLRDSLDADGLAWWTATDGQAP
jgi:hypothetical protein